MVLNETCELLGIAKCKTQDQLIRDMLASTASAINSTGGSNGMLKRIFAVLKSSLIVLESEVAFS